MAGFADGGGNGFAPGFGQAIGAIGNTVKKVAKKAAAPAPRRNTPRRRPSNGGGGGGGGTRVSAPRNNVSRTASRQPTVTRPQVSRPAVGSTSRGTVAPSVPAPAKPPMTLDQWLATDTAYLTQKNAYDKAAKDYAAQDAAERAKYNTEYDAAGKKLETEKGLAQTALNDDYAARGMLTSGLYADALNDFQNSYATKQADAERARTGYLDDLTTDKTNFTTQQQLELQRAQDAAAARRKAQLGL